MNLDASSRRGLGDWRSWLAATIVGVAIYATITSFSPISADNAKAAATNTALAAASLMMLIMFRGLVPLRWAGTRRVLVAATALTMIVSTMASPRPHIAWERLVLYCILILLGMAVYVLHRDAERPSSTPYWLAIGIVHAAVLVEVVAWLAQAAPGADRNHYLPYHANVRHFGYLGYLAAASAAAVTLRSSRLTTTGLLLCLAALYGIVQLGSRGALLGWTTFVAVACALGPRDERWRLALVTGFCTVAAFGLASVASNVGLSQGGSLIDRAGYGELTAGMGRISLWADVLRAIAERPWFGYGPDGHGLLQCCGTYGPYVSRTSQPHNVVLQLLEEFGIVGTALIAATMAHVLLDQVRPVGWKSLVRSDIEIRLLIAMLAGMLAFGMVDGPFYYPVPLMIATVSIGLILAAARRVAERCPGA
jgi:O-antigen ligase